MDFVEYFYRYEFVLEPIFAMEQMTTEFAMEQLATEFAMDQMATEFATEQNRYGICYIIHYYGIVMELCCSWNATDRCHSKDHSKIATEL